MHFPITLVCFYAFAALLIISAFMVIFSRNPVQSALYLVLAFFASAALWIILQAEFLGLILILVYVGAVMTLFLFVVMTLPFHPPHQPYSLKAIGGAVFFIIFFMVIMFKAIAPFAHISNQLKEAPIFGLSSVEAIGLVLYTQYVFPFEIAGLLLLVAIVAAISLSWKAQRKSIQGDPGQQVKVSATSRLKIV